MTQKKQTHFQLLLVSPVSRRREAELRCCSPSTSSPRSQRNTLGGWIDISLKCHSWPCSSITSSSYLQPAWISVDPAGQHLRPAPEVGADTAARVTFLQRVSLKVGFMWTGVIYQLLAGKCDVFMRKLLQIVPNDQLSSTFEWRFIDCLRWHK